MSPAPETKCRRRRRPATSPSRLNTDGIAADNQPSLKVPSKFDSINNDLFHYSRRRSHSPKYDSIPLQGILYNAKINAAERRLRRGKTQPRGTRPFARIKYHAALTLVILVASLVVSDAFNSRATKPQPHVEPMPTRPKRGWVVRVSQRPLRIEQLRKLVPKRDCDPENERNNAPSQIQRLLLALSGYFYHYPTDHDGHLPEESPYFTPSEINEVMDSLRVAAQGNYDLMDGCADFLYLMLTLEEEGLSTNYFSSRKHRGQNEETRREEEEEPGRSRPNPHSIMTRDVLVAAAFHYCDCVRAREAGVYEAARRAMEASLDIRIQNEQKQNKSVALVALKQQLEQEITADVGRNGSVIMTPDEYNKSLVVRTVNRVTEYGEESAKIAEVAARLKRAEIMSTLAGQTSRGHKTQPDDDAEILRSFLVSLSGDWRGLVIRSAASLYRLRGIVDDQEYVQKSTGGSGVLSTTTMNTARDAFRVYAPLAQRLGMQRLKMELENNAFKLLYPRQFAVASSLYSGDIDEMKHIVRVLSSRIEQILQSDSVFVEQSDVTVSSRVKSPYSLWRKLLKSRQKLANAKHGASPNRRFAPASLSLNWVPDTIAFRVVLCARRLSSLEDDESVRTREKMLCYYALQLISDVYQASSSKEAKDFIKNPKPNGYQSLHYTASLMIAGKDWPFEVQIRSEEMHRIAEFGVAAHWDYKLQNKVIQSLPSQPPLQKNARNSIRILAETVAGKVNTTETTTLSSSRVAKKGRIASYIEALTTSREVIVQNNIFVFLSSTKSALDGRIVSIDPSACNVAHVLQKYKDTIDEYMLDGISEGRLKLFKNGISTSLDAVVCNGDVLTLPS